MVQPHSLHPSLRIRSIARIPVHGKNPGFSQPCSVVITQAVSGLQTGCDERVGWG
jgi:hypothetical protein